MRVGLDVIRAGLGHLLQTCEASDALEVSGAAAAPEASKPSKSTQALYGF